MPFNRTDAAATRISTVLLTSAALATLFTATAVATPAHRGAHPVGLGKVLTTRDGGQIFGFDINQTGDDGVLESTDLNQQVPANSIETFDQNTGKIVRSFAKSQGEENSYEMVGIFAGDVALITRFVPYQGIISKEKYSVMNPVTANKFTGAWKPPVRHVYVKFAANNQATSTSVIYGIEIDHQNNPDLLVSDVATNTFSNVIPLGQVFSLNTIPHLAQYTAANEAVLATSPDQGKRGGAPPINALFDLSTGKVTQFDGYNNGFYHAGLVNGLAVDPSTGVAATTTELNAQVEFYDLNKKKGITFVQLPCTGDQDQFNSGASITNDPVNKLFLVTDLHYCDGSQGTAIVVYDESGNLIESITGFNPDIGFAVDQPPPRINPSKRMGWAFGGPQSAGESGVNQLQQFFY